MAPVTWIIAMLVAGAIAEGIARWWIRRRRAYYVFPPGLRLRLHIDPVVFPQLERETRFDINREGERGHEVPSSAEGLYRVLVAGGSQPEGYLLDQDSTWPGALQHLLDTPASRDRLGASRVHVGSIARSGVGSEALDLIFDRLLPRYPRVQLIVILVGATDVLRWLEQGAPPAVTPVRTADVFRCHPEGPFGWTPGTLAVGELLRRARRRWLRPTEVHEGAGRWIGHARELRAGATEIRSTVPDPTAMLDSFADHFGRVLARARARADRVLVIRQPWFDKEYSREEAAVMWHGGAGQVWREDVAAFYSFRVCSCLMARLDARTADVADAFGIEHLDLMGPLERSLETYYDGFHLTAKGARATADVIARAILDRPARQQPAAHEPHDATAVRREEALRAS